MRNLQTYEEFLMNEANGASLEIKLNELIKNLISIRTSFGPILTKLGHGNEFRKYAKVTDAIRNLKIAVEELIETGNLNESFYRINSAGLDLLWQAKGNLESLYSSLSNGGDFKPNYLETIEKLLHDAKKHAKSFNNKDEVPKDYLRESVSLNYVFGEMSKLSKEMKDDERKISALYGRLHTKKQMLAKELKTQNEKLEDLNLEMEQTISHAQNKFDEASDKSSVEHPDKTAAKFANEHDKLSNLVWKLEQQIDSIFDPITELRKNLIDKKARYTRLEASSKVKEGLFDSVEESIANPEEEARKNRGQYIHTKQKTSGTDPAIEYMDKLEVAAASIHQKLMSYTNHQMSMPPSMKANFLHVMSDIDKQRNNLKHIYGVYYYPKAYMLSPIN